MVKDYICLGGASKQDNLFFFLKNVPQASKFTIITIMSTICPDNNIS